MKSALVLGAVVFAKEEIVISVEPVGLRQQIGPAAHAGRQRIDREVEALAVGAALPQRPRRLAEQFVVRPVDDDAVAPLAAAGILDRDDGDRLLGVVGVDDHCLDQRRIQVAQPHGAGHGIGEGGITLLAEQCQFAHALGQLEIHLVDGVAPEGIQRRLGGRVLDLQLDALGQQEGQRQFDQPVGQQVGLPEVSGDLAHARLGDRRQVAGGVAGEAAPAGVIIGDRGAGGLAKRRFFAGAGENPADEARNAHESASLCLLRGFIKAPNPPGGYPCPTRRGKIAWRPVFAFCPRRRSGVNGSATAAMVAPAAGCAPSSAACRASACAQNSSAWPSSERSASKRGLPATVCTLRTA
ncbi:MAG: hypothetical protein IPJ52_00085 [Rhodocyclaceae bacterium]|nr:hypothetical protein [Rhodocyclaceae bacterium]